MNLHKPYSSLTRRNFLKAAVVSAPVATALAAMASAENAAAAPAAAAPAADASIIIGFLMETYDVNRWQRDEQMFMEKAASLGATVKKAVADGDQDRQNKQADAMLVQGANVLVVVPKNLKTASRIVISAHEKKVPVLAYDRLIRDSDVDLYITFDNEKVGYLQAKGILEKVPEGNYILLGGAATDNNAKYLREGQLRAIAEHEKATGKKITVLADPFLDNWDREEARRRIVNLLTKFKAEGKKVDAIVASNDSTAGGAAAALKADQLDGKVALSGQDAELTACQRIVEGTQTLTVYKPIRTLAGVSAEIAVRLAKGEKPENIIQALGYKVNLLDNGQKKVPSIFLEPQFVTKDNMVSVVVKDGWHKMEDVYKNVPKDQWPKK
ncbi:MAG: substrate-binding domain-containing protein [Candidatus Sumerlaeota bacterium]|nr:substrate-binding domain-containing protein [Candidatus Sumerlaeota bacterium]